MAADCKLDKNTDGLHIEAVIFDMDGLMFDTERLHKVMWARVEKESGMSFLSGMPDMTGMNAAATSELYRKKYGDDFDYYALRDKNRNYCDEYIAEHGVPEKPGLKELLETLRFLNIPCALATSTDKETAMRLISAAGLENYFKAAVFGDEVLHSKPDPEVFLTAAARLRVRPENTLVLEDSVNGATAGCDGGFLTFMVPDLVQPSPELEARLAGKLYSLLEVIPIVRGQNN